MSKKRLAKPLWYGSEIDHDGNPVPPAPAVDGDNLSGLIEGEIYIHNHPEKPSLFIRTTDGKVHQVTGVDFDVLDQLYLSKIKDDRSKGLIASDKGFEVGEFTSGATGVGVYQNADGQWVIETDNLSVRRKFSANEVEIQTTNHIGGQTLLTAARMVIESVDEMADRFRCIYRKRDGEGNVISQQWKVGDLAFCNTFNLEKQADGAIGNHYYWREVVEVSANNWNEDYYYVDLSISKCASGSSIPKQGDKVVQLGYSGNDDANRQNAIIIAGAGTGSPYIQLFVGIKSSELPEPEQLKPGDNRLSGRLTIKEGSTGWRNLEGLPDSIQEALTMSEEAKKFVESQEYGKNNLLRNSGFTGDYVTASLQEGDVLTGGSDMFSPSLVHWIPDGATPMESDVSESGKEVMLISGGSLRQEIVNKVMVGESYVFSFRGRGIGSVTFSFGGYTKSIAFNSEDWELYVEKFVATADSQRFTIEAYEDCFLCELQLERGTLRSAWGISPLDNRSELAKYESLRYMSDAIEKGSTDVFGGLILTNMMLMRNLENKVTSGSSGLYSDDNSVAYFAGGDMEAAVRTAMAYMDDPTYQPTQEELNNMAKYVVTHGGRAILNDVILRGYIYALGGKFKGEIEATSGIFKNVTSPNGNFLIDDEGKVRIVGTIETSLNGKRIVLDAETQSITLFDEYGRETVKMDFLQDVGESWTYGRILMSRYAGTSNTVQFRTEMIPNYISMENLATGIRSAYEPEGVMVTTSDGSKDCSMYINSTNKIPTMKADKFWSGSKQGISTSISINANGANHSLIFNGGILTGYERIDKEE